LDELIIAGELQESSKKSVLRVVGFHSRPPFSCNKAKAPVQVTQSDHIEEQEASEDTIARIGSRVSSQHRILALILSSSNQRMQA
jgi:AP-1 complex subunit sigma 1/2